MSESRERPTIVPLESGQAMELKDASKITLPELPKTEKSPTEKSLDELLEEKLTECKLDLSNHELVISYALFLLRKKYGNDIKNPEKINIFRQNQELQITIDLYPENPEERGPILDFSLHLNELSPVLELAEIMHSGKAQRATIAPLLFALHENKLFSLHYSDNGIDVFPHESDVTLFTLTDEAFPLTKVEQSMLKEDPESLGELCEVWQYNLCLQEKKSIESTETKRKLHEDELKKYKKHVTKIHETTTLSVVERLQKITLSQDTSRLALIKNIFIRPSYDWKKITDHIGSEILRIIKENVLIHEIAQREQFILSEETEGLQIIPYQRTLTSRFLFIPKKSYQLHLPQDILNSFGSRAKEVSLLQVQLISNSKENVMLSKETTDLEQTTI